MATTITEDAHLLERLEAMGPEDLLRWAATQHGMRAGIITSFQDTGTVIIDMASKVAPELRVLTIDTLRLHPETYALIDEIEAHYGIAIERFQPDPDKLRTMVNHHGEYLFFDSKDKQEFCCAVRKVEPNVRALRTVDVWITGLRQDQSNMRAETPKVEYIQREESTIVKIAPLADWTSQRVKEYIADNKVPYNKLYDQGYTSIGCMICSTPTLPNEPPRAGRWRWFNDSHEDEKECGIHTNVDGGGI